MRIKDTIKNIQRNNEESQQIQKDFFESSQKELKAIISLLTKDLSKFNKQDFIDKFEEYLKNYHRIFYSTCSFEFYNYRNSSDLDEHNKANNIINNLTNVVNAIDFSKELTEVDKAIIKLLDHAHLANYQVDAMEVTEEKVEPYIQKAHTKISAETEKKIYDEKDKLFSNLISIVAIFTAISFVMFGGMSLLNNLFDYSNMSTIPLLEMLSGGSLIGIIIVVAMYLFVLFILRITDKLDKNDKNPYKSTVFWTIGILTIVTIATCFLWFFNIRNIDDVNRINSKCKVVSEDIENNTVELVCPKEKEDLKDKNDKIQTKDGN